MKRAKKIIDNVYWVGVRDLNNRHFHGDLYPIDEGCTYPSLEVCTMNV